MDNTLAVPLILIGSMLLSYIVSLIIDIITWHTYIMDFKCKKCGTQIIHGAEDYSGGRGYYCKTCGRSIWLSAYCPGDISDKQE